MGDKKEIVLAVIIPCYNGEKYINQAILSVIKQPKKELIVIAVDDGSTDNTYSILKKLQKDDDRLYVIHQENKGVSSARNRGIKEAIDLGASYLAFLDADDVWCKNVFNNEVYDILKSKEYELLGFGLYQGDISLQRGLYQASNTSKKLYTFHFCAHIYMTSLLVNNSISFPVNCKVNEDLVYYFLFAYYSNSYFYVNKALFARRSNPDSVTHSKRDLDEVYFNSIIPAWDWAGKKVCKDKDAFHECETMKKTMVAEYIVEACKEGYSIKRIKKRISDSGLDYYSESDNVWIDDRSKSNYTSFSNKPYTFWLKYRVKGIVFNIVQFFARVPIIKNIRYPDKLSSII